MKVYFKFAGDFLRGTVEEEYPELNWLDEYCEINDSFPEDRLHEKGSNGITYQERVNNAVEKERYLVEKSAIGDYWRIKVWEKSKRYYLNINTLDELAKIQKIIKNKFILSFDKIKIDGNSPDFIGGGESLGRPIREEGTAFCLIYDNYIE